MMQATAFSNGSRCLRRGAEELMTRCRSDGLPFASQVSRLLTARRGQQQSSGSMRARPTLIAVDGGEMRALHALTIYGACARRAIFLYNADFESHEMLKKINASTPSINCAIAAKMAPRRWHAPLERRSRRTRLPGSGTRRARFR